MSDYAFVADRAKKAFASLARMEDAVARDPKDRAAAFNLVSVRRAAERARADFERLAEINRIEVCQYRMVPVDEPRYGLAHVSKSLLEYQYLFSQIYDAFRNGKKIRATIGHDAEVESTLEFAFSHSGSLNVVLLARSERDFFEGNLDKPIEALYQIMDINDLDAVKDVAQSLGRAVVKRVHDWSKANVEAGFSADIQWKRSDGRLMRQMIDKSQMSRIVEYIGSTSDEQSTEIEVIGMLVGGNVSSMTFHISVPNGETYNGHMLEDAELPSDLILGRMYIAEIRTSETYHYATQRTVTTFFLSKLVGPLPSLAGLNSADSN